MLLLYQSGHGHSHWQFDVACARKFITIVNMMAISHTFEMKEHQLQHAAIPFFLSIKKWSESTNKIVTYGN